LQFAKKIQAGIDLLGKDTYRGASLAFPTGNTMTVNGQRNISATDIKEMYVKMVAQARSSPFPYFGLILSDFDACFFL
jgi:hypothetical protein